MIHSFMKAVKQRRSYYGLSKNMVISVDRMQEIVNEAIQYVPSAFHSQSAKVLVLFGEEGRVKIFNRNVDSL